MMLNEVILKILSEEAVLFAGSGFSFGAKNLNKKSFPVGDGLRDIIAKDCGIDKTTQSLQATAQYYLKIKGKEKLIELLKREFCVDSIMPWHTELLSLSWKRIYTTNYDSVIETAGKSNGKIITPIVLSDKMRNFDVSKVCVHLNGYIDRLDLNTLDKEFKLTDTSYSCDVLEGNDWFELFKEDLSSAGVILIIGYSMQFDLDIKRLLSSPTVQKKVVFIDKKDPDEISRTLLEQYGSCEFIGVDNFADKISQQRKGFVPQVCENTFISFEYEHQKTKIPSKVSFEQLNDFYTKGEFAEELLTDNHGDYKYIIYRDRITTILRNYKNQKVYLILSDLGNGKSIFCKILKDQLRQEDVNIFTLQSEQHDIDSEIDRICANKEKHTFVFLDDYKSKQHILRKFKYHNKGKMTFVLTSRKSINPTNYPVVQALDIREEDIRVVLLDILTSNEIDNLAYIITSNSLYSTEMEDRKRDSIKRYIANDCHAQFASILLNTYNSSNIKDKLLTLWDESKKEHEAVRMLAILALMKSVMGIDLNIAQILDLLSIDFVLVSGKTSPLIQELFNFEGDDVKIKSSVIAREVLKNIIGIQSLLETMKVVVHKADTLACDNPIYEELLKNLVSHSHFRIFNATPANQTMILCFYDDIRNCSFCKNNLFYWEQFASACIDCQNYTTANQCIENAFTIAKEKPGDFVPFHVTNIQARCWIEELLYKANTELKPSASEAIEVLNKCHESLLKYYRHPENNVSYTFRVAYKYVKIFDLWKDKFNDRERSVFIEKKTEMLRLMKERQNDSVFLGHPLTQWIRELESCKW